MISMNFSRTALGKWLFACVLWTYFACAHAAPSCTFSGLTLNPAAPARIVVAPSVPAGKLIYSTTLRANFSCTGVFTDAVVITPPVLDTDTLHALNGAGVTNVSISDSSQATYSETAGGGGADCGVNATSNRKIYVKGFPCTGIVTLALGLYATGTGAVSGTIPSNMSNVNTPAFAGWLVAVQCLNSTCTSLNTGAPVGSINGPSIPIVTQTTTCTLTSPTNQTVTLPNVSPSAFQAAGSTAGVQRFTISYNCGTSGGAKSLTMNWFFDSINPGSSSTNFILKNTANPTANVAVVIKDSAGNTAVTGRPSMQIASVANGSNTMTYYAMYYAITTPVNPTTVSGMAQYTATYN